MSPAASSRWCPTPEQLMMLEELYRTGIRTPNASQIQRITARLSLYGKIEGKNVFYWFQNHKARDRQKLRRKLIKQLQLQQHHLHQPFSSSLFHLHSLPAFLPPYQRTFDGAATETVNEGWKVEIPETMQMGMRMYGCDWMMTIMEVGRSNSPCTSKPLETLQLFPTTSTDLKQA